MVCYVSCIMKHRSTSARDVLVQSRVPAEVFRKISEAARKDGRSMSSWLRQLLVKHFGMEA